MNNELKRNQFFYGWIIAVCCTLFICASSLLSTGMSTNLNAMRETLGLTNTQTSMILTVRSISAFAASLASDRFFKALGVKKGLLIAMSFGIAAFLVFSIAGTNMIINYVAAALGGICYSYGMMLPASLLIKNWFNKCRGVALSIASCGTGLVSIIFAPMVQKIVNTSGIKAAFLVQAGVIAAVGLLILLFVFDKPEQKGLEIFGGKAWKPENNTGNKTLKATSLSKFWYIGLIVATTLIGMSASPSSANYTNNLVTAGFDNMTVAKCISVYGFVIIGSKLLLGRSVDKLGTFKTTLIFGTICTAGMILLAMVNYFPTVPFMYAAMITIGLGAVIQTLGYPNWCADLDSMHYATIIARCQMGYQFGAVIGSFLPGPIADLTGSYATAYWMFALCTIGAIIIVIGAYASQRKDHSMHYI